ncbi:hypothetical protein GCM10009573_22760 [Agromyces bracchium]
MLRRGIDEGEVRQVGAETFVGRDRGVGAIEFGHRSMQVLGDVFWLALGHGHSVGRAPSRLAVSVRSRAGE